ncbi:MAG TPA: disulfide bond formation protein B [Burkholderiaceae bacterium]|nr:disulfide bond formation protein B [Burkholderiaceae bacterium]
MTPTRVFAAVAAVCVAAVGAALVSQYKFDMQPCPWCVLQRVIFLAVAAVCVIGLIWRSASGRVAAGALALLLALGGLAAALWQHFQAAASASCNLTLADRIVSGWLGLDALWPDVFSARASCAEAQVSLLGVPYDFWSAALFVLVALALALGVLRRAR